MTAEVIGEVRETQVASAPLILIDRSTVPLIEICKVGEALHFVKEEWHFIV